MGPGQSVAVQMSQTAPKLRMNKLKILPPRQRLEFGTILQLVSTLTATPTWVLHRFIRPNHGP